MSTNRVGPMVSTCVLPPAVMTFICGCLQRVARLRKSDARPCANRNPYWGPKSKSSTARTLRIE
ncbi:MAG: hypothetical protein MUF54_25175, partial [Polyangiaceae bacterium]|nr:hypothetical protein [Polyangiaceae bacterium]